MHLKFLRLFLSVEYYIDAWIYENRANLKTRIRNQQILQETHCLFQSTITCGHVTAEHRNSPCSYDAG